MTVSVTIERPFSIKFGKYKSDIVTRVWWGWFAIKRIKVSEYEYAITSYDWREQ